MVLLLPSARAQLLALGFGLYMEACAVLGAKATESGPLPLAGFWVLHVGWNILASQEEHHLVDG
jgi:hypothetical protein